MLMLAVLVSGESGRDFGGTAFRTRLKTRRGTFSQWILDSFLGGGDAIVVEEVETSQHVEHEVDVTSHSHSHILSVR